MNPAVEWLEAEFVGVMDVWSEVDLDEWRGPSYVRPMIQLRTITDGGKPMSVGMADYADPERWWL